MAIRVTEAEVREIIDIDVAFTNVDSFIAAANRVVEDNLAGLVDNAGNQRISDETLKEIERWLSAHFQAVQDKRFTRERAGENDVSYEGKTQYYFKFTGYGQMAVMLDPTGTLMNLEEGEKPKATLKVFTRD